MKTKSLALIINNLLLITHVLQFVRSDHYWKPVIYIILCFLFNVAVIIKDSKYLSEFFLIAGIGFIIGSRFDCPAPYMLVAIGIYLKPHRRIVYTLVYVAAWLAMMAFYHDTFTHAIIHGCIIALVCIGELHLEKGHPKRKPLDLTSDELTCIAHIADGMEVKEVPEFSENTVYKKLKEARIRNGINTNWELIARYKDSL